MSILENIRDILLQHGGQSNVISARDIANQIGINAGVSMVNIRKLIKDAIIRFELPIASNNRGYYLLENNLEDLRRYQRSLKRRAYEIIERNFIVTRNFMRFYNREQPELTGESINIDELEDFNDYDLDDF